MMRYIRIRHCTVAGSYRCLIAMFIIISNLVVLALSQVVVSQPPHHSDCSVQQNVHDSVQGIYSAPARFVPAPPVDPLLQQEFFRLFQNDPNYNQSFTRGIGPQEQLPPGLQQSDLDYIAQICPPDAFFYSLSPPHVAARNILQQYLAAQPTPSEVLRVARIILKNHEINPKIWYFALVGAVLERSDMNGVIIAQPLDAMPDLFIPAQALSEALNRYRVQYQPTHSHVTTHHTTINTATIASNYLDNQVEYSEEQYLTSATTLRAPLPQSVVPSVSIKRHTGLKNGRRRRGRKRNTAVGAALRRKSSSVSKTDDNKESISSAASSYHAVGNANGIRRRGNANSTVKYGHKLSYGEDDDDYDELKMIHEISGNNTRQLRQRILQRRQRRKHRAKRQVFGSHLHHDGIGECVLVNGTVGADNGDENKLWYFREDIMVNQHHWYWHQMYPLNATRHGDRRAELFFYLHRNLVARYNAERLSNGMPRTTEMLLRQGTIIEEGYNSHLIDMNSRRFWTARNPNTPLTDIFHEQDPDFGRSLFLKDLTDIYYKLIFSIKGGALVGLNNQPIPIRNRDGIEHLGNTVEATELSINPMYYDAMGIHNLGHQLLGLSADPQFLGRLPTGVMGDTSVTMRDPAFYTFHSGIDNLFDKYKRTLPPYQLHNGEWPLVWDGVEVVSIQTIPHLNDGHPNNLRTYWSTQRFPLESGIDNSIHNGNVKADICALHLNQEPFTFRMIVNVSPCVHSLSGQGMVRIFMAPRYDEYGHRFPLKVQRRLMFQLDVFPVKLQQGKNIIIRSSEDSSLTKPWPRSMRDSYYSPHGNNGGGADYCGCGWPRHLLIPKGTPQGMEYDLFAMVTNFDQDGVQDSIEDLRIPQPCNSPYLFCGVPWRRYPDARPMGYPFDRLPYKVPAGCTLGSVFPDMLCKLMQQQWFRQVETLDEYVHSAPNMIASVVVVQHVDTLIAQGAQGV